MAESVQITQLWFTLSAGATAGPWAVAIPNSPPFSGTGGVPTSTEVTP